MEEENKLTSEENTSEENTSVENTSEENTVQSDSKTEQTPADEGEQEQPESVTEKSKRTSGKKSAWAKKNVPFLIIEAIVLCISIVILYVVTITTSSVKKVDVDTDKVVINDTVVAKQQADEEKKKTDPTYTGSGIRNIALFGVDSRVGDLDKRTRSDTMIIASIDQDNHEIKLISLYRDTYLNLGNDKYAKCNAAYAYGGPEQAMTMLNMNFDLDITDYVTIGFEGLSEAVDALGGVEIDVAEDEISHLNNYQRSMYVNEDGTGELNNDIEEVYESGIQTLNGLQATAYCRIRYTAGNDFKRTERQRQVIMQLFSRAKTSSLTKLTRAVTAVMPNVETSLKVDDILGLLTTIGDYNVTTSEGLPFEEHRYSARLGSDGWVEVPVSLEDNAIRLHQIIYPDEEYTPSDTVVEISNYIAEYSAPYMQ